MYCGNCGMQLPDNANYCMKCGKQQITGVAPLDESKWENCEIEMEWITNSIIGAFGFGGDKVCFQAKAIGINGFYIAGQSEVFKERPVDTGVGEGIRILEDFVAVLAKDRWEPLETKGEKWYSYRFRRPVKPK